MVKVQDLKRAVKTVENAVRSSRFLVRPTAMKVVGYREKNRIMARLKENLKKVKKGNDPVAEREIIYALGCLDVYALMDILTSLPPRQKDMFCAKANPLLQAELSTMQLHVEKFAHCDRRLKTLGFYRLCLVKDEQKLVVHFKYKESIVVYLIYLLDKLNRDEVDSLRIESHKPLFVALYNEIYPSDDASKRFDDMVKRVDSKGNPRQAQIKHCYSDIRVSISQACVQMDELPAPFILRDADDHLAVLPERIFVHENLQNVAEK